MNQSAPWELLDAMPVGASQRLMLQFPDEPLRDIEIPCIAVRGVADGPSLAIVAGVHGGEYPGPAAAIRLSRELDPARLSGNVVIVPIANQTAFWNRTAFVTPDDGVNLNRSFPGDLNGSFSNVLAFRLFDAIVRPADALIDLHSGDIFESLSPFAGFYESSDADLCARSEAIARAFDVPIVDRFPQPDAANESLTAAAMLAGKASVIVEVGGNGLLTKADETTVFEGLLNALRAIGCLDEPVKPTTPTMYEPVDGADAPVGGLWRPAISLNQPVSAGDRLGVITDQFGDERAVIESPADGEVVFYMTCLPVAAGEFLVALGRPLER